MMDIKVGNKYMFLRGEVEVESIRLISYPDEFAPYICVKGKDYYGGMYLHHFLDELKAVERL